MGKIFVVDSIMGSGKTSAAINKMNEDIQNNYIFITPYLNEVDRIITSCQSRKFSQPEHKGKGKLENLHYLLGRKTNIASTHALFRSYNSYTLDLLKQGDYVLVLDEVCNVVELVNLSKSDVHYILKNYAHVEDDQIIWDELEYSGRFDDIRDMALNKNLIYYKESIMVWNFPIDIFKAFKEVYILTYMFDAQQQKYYYDYNNVEYSPLGVEYKNNIYRFSENSTTPPYVLTLKDKISILEEEKMNSIGDNYYGLSSTWFAREQKTRNKFLLKTLKNNLVNYFIKKVKSKSDKNMWTTFKEHKPSLSGKGYTKGFVTINARATNEFRDRKYLAYCANIFMNPILQQYFRSKGTKVNEEKYALSELIQWIWRSAIRDDENINIYIPSSRMRNLLIDWLDDLSKGEC